MMMLAVSSASVSWEEGEEMEQDLADVLDSIDFDHLLDDVVLPDLHLDPHFFPDLSLPNSTQQHQPPPTTTSQDIPTQIHHSPHSLLLNPSPIHNTNNHKRRKSKINNNDNSINNNHHQVKKKVKKVDWTPELHRRFVQAVEQLGVDKAVPSRILEIMGIQCLTRHNIASHLQKYRSHRKHLLAREAEAANWSQRRQHLYGGRGGKREAAVSPWLATPPPTTIIGYPPVTPPTVPMHHFRPLHVWGHPPMDHSFMHHTMWPNNNNPSSQSPPPPPPSPSFWRHPPHHQRATNALTAGAPCFPQPLTTTRFGSPAVGVIPPPPPPPHAAAMYKVDPGIGVPAARQPPPQPLFDFHPSKESVDAAIGDVLSKPWLPLPLGLKAPALDSVMGELQRQGIPKIPPSCA